LKVILKKVKAIDKHLVLHYLCKKNKNMKKNDYYNDGNKLIIEFMGEETVYNDGEQYVCPRCEHVFSAMLGDNEIPVIHSDCLYDILYEAQYHKSWDWLKPVIDKIIKDIVGVKEKDECSQMEWFQYTRITSMNIGIDIERAWFYVTEFLDWHKNLNK
jgi:hypothetical protein